MKKILLIYPPYERFRYGWGEDFPIGLGQRVTVLQQIGKNDWKLEKTEYL
ncbi:hypothetical protein ES708_20491 [subsurface metagenome]